MWIAPTASAFGEPERGSRQSAWSTAQSDRCSKRVWETGMWLAPRLMEHHAISPIRTFLLLGAGSLAKLEEDEESEDSRLTPHQLVPRQRTSCRKRPKGLSARHRLKELGALGVGHRYRPWFGDRRILSRSDVTGLLWLSSSGAIGVPPGPHCWPGTDPWPERGAVSARSRQLGTEARPAGRRPAVINPWPGGAPRRSNRTPRPKEGSSTSWSASSTRTVRVRPCRT